MKEKDMGGIRWETRQRYYVEHLIETLRGLGTDRRMTI
jgi:hypothetical protein